VLGTKGLDSDPWITIALICGNRRTGRLEVRVHAVAVLLSEIRHAESRSWRTVSETRLARVAIRSRVRGVACSPPTVARSCPGGYARETRASGDRSAASVEGAIPVPGNDCAEGQTTRYRGGGASVHGVGHPLAVKRVPRE